MMSCCKKKSRKSAARRSPERRAGDEARRSEESRAPPPPSRRSRISSFRSRRCQQHRRPLRRLRRLTMGRLRADSDERVRGVVRRRRCPRRRAASGSSPGRTTRSSSSAFANGSGRPGRTGRTRWRWSGRTRSPTIDKPARRAPTRSSRNGRSVGTTRSSTERTTPSGRGCSTPPTSSPPAFSAVSRPPFRRRRFPIFLSRRCRGRCLLDKRCHPFILKPDKQGVTRRTTRTPPCNSTPEGALYEDVAALVKSESALRAA
mmetsp:Transcript_19141/g.61607  ORF Transcript_19141/g.61607 Transcript_19141/m.61607 type:complete len:260 (+) Transcript_19141:251-1030(+)